MEEKKKSNKGLVFIIILLILIILGLVGYICYDKGLIFKTEKEVVTTNNKNTKEQKLDVDSRLVQTLYSNVTTGSTSCDKNWIYGQSEDAINPYKDEFNVKTATEEEKMNFVGNLLSEKKREYVDCDSSKVPTTMKAQNQKFTHSSICSIKTYDLSHADDEEYTYPKEYVESLYKSLFGKSEKLDTNAYIQTDSHNIMTYYYISDLDKYVLYTINAGGTCGPQKYEDTIESAILKNKILKIKEKEVYSEEGKEDTTTYYVYTFEKESDGMYKFISRLKQN